MTSYIRYENIIIYNLQNRIEYEINENNKNYYRIIEICNQYVSSKKFDRMEREFRKYYNVRNTWLMDVGKKINSAKNILNLSSRLNIYIMIVKNFYQHLYNYKDPFRKMNIYQLINECLFIEKRV